MPNAVLAPPVIEVQILTFLPSNFEISVWISGEAALRVCSVLAILIRLPQDDESFDTRNPPSGERDGAMGTVKWTLGSADG